MPYKLTIRNEQGQPIASTIFLYDDTGREIGEVVTRDGEITLLDEDIEGVASFRFTSPGYGWYGTSTLYSETVITLVKERSPVIPLVLGGVLVFFAIKLLKLKA